MKIQLIAAAVLGSFVLAGCGGGGGDGPATDAVDPAGNPLSFVDVVQGGIVESGTYHVVGASDAFLQALEDAQVPANGYAPDSMITIGGVSFRCTADNVNNCNIAVHEDGSFTTVGTIATVLFGGTPPTTSAEQLILAERARVEAERARADAEQARADAEQARADAAEAQREREQAAREAAEERLNQSDEERQSAGFGTSAGTLVVTVRRPGSAAPELVIGTPDIGTQTGSTATPWSVVTVDDQSDGTHLDSVAVRTDIEAADTTVPFQDSTYNAGNRVFNAQGMRVGSVPISGARTDVMGTGMNATQFPDTSGPARSFDLTDLGYYQTQAQKDAAEMACAGVQACEDEVAARGVRADESPLRYRAQVAGAMLAGAAGNFRCESSSANTVCSVQNRGGNQLFFTGPWKFIPNDDATVTVADANYMWYGWWARQNIATKEYSYAVGHGPAGSRVSSVSAVSGTATYTGTAIGRYAIDDPLDDTDQVGDFMAAASLSANFDDNTLSGTLMTFAGVGADATDFPDQGTNPWTVHLRKGSISGGSASGTSAWTIGPGTHNVDEGGEWSANFYSDLPANQRTGVVPYGVAGTFTAEHSGAANMIGAFGAHTRPPSQ